MGYLSQEPQLDPAKDVRGNVMEGVAAKQALVDRYNEIAANYTDETADEMARLQDEIEAQGLWDLDSKVDQAMDALRCPDGDAQVETLSGGERRRVALCKLLLDAPDILLLGRTHQPSGRGIGGVAGSDAARVQRLRHPGDPWTAISWTMSPAGFWSWIAGKGIPHEGNYSSFLEIRKSA